MSVYAYFVGGWLLLVGGLGIVRGRDLVHAVVCLAVAQSGTYVLLIAVGYQRGAGAPVFGSDPPSTNVVDPLVQAMTLTDIVVSATVTALLLALTMQIAKRHHGAERGVRAVGRADRLYRALRRPVARGTDRGRATRRPGVHWVASAALRARR